jgi:hypothetical protein
MASTWKTITVPEVKAGDRIRFRNTEFVVGRVDSPFLGMDQMVCIIEDTPTRWHAYPGSKAESVEVEVEA